MHIDVVSLFPDSIRNGTSHSIVGRAKRRGQVSIDAVDPRSWAGGRHRVVDGRPAGGGPGMVMAVPPIAAAVDHCRSRGPGSRLLMTSPQGRRLDQAWLQDLSTESHLIVVCGHYEGIDERFADLYQPEEFSIGDLVLSGGELAALVLVDGIVRLLPGVLGDASSAVDDSFTEGELDHPAYTKPREFRGLRIPDVLQGGDHKAIDAWRAEQRRKRTQERRPDLL